MFFFSIEILDQLNGGARGQFEIEIFRALRRADVEGLLPMVKARPVFMRKF